MLNVFTYNTLNREEKLKFWCSQKLTRISKSVKIKCHFNVRLCNIINIFSFAKWMHFLTVKTCCSYYLLFGTTSKFVCINHWSYHISRMKKLNSIGEFSFICFYFTILTLNGKNSVYNFYSTFCLFVYLDDCSLYVGLRVNAMLTPHCLWIYNCGLKTLAL